MTLYNIKFMSTFLFSLLLSSIFFTSTVNGGGGGITVELIHRDSSRSPSYNSSHTCFQRRRDAFDRAFSRQAALASLLSISIGIGFLDSADSIDAPITRGGGEYLMKVKLGTPAVEQLLIVDTGSDLLWTQCEPCKQCYKQDLPLFDPSTTSTYRTISCESDLCTAAGSSSCDGRNGCRYGVGYGDRSYSNGELATETLTLGETASFPKIAFGCGHQNDGTFSRAGSGIIGLGGGSISIINQLKNSIGGKFSYCLSPDSNVSSKISFGSNAVVGGDNAVSTPLVRKSPPTFYFLTLEGMSVGTNRINHLSSSLLEGDDGNIIIDSGTTLTFIPSEMYEGVESALKEAIAATPVSDSQGRFKLCYEGGARIRSPPITAHFKGADVVLPEGSVFVEVEEGVVCLAVVAAQNLAIFGNLHQVNYQIGYDLGEGKVTFLPADCSNSSQRIKPIS